MNAIGAIWNDSPIKYVFTSFLVFVSLLCKMKYILWYENVYSLVKRMRRCFEWIHEESNLTDTVCFFASSTSLLHIYEQYETMWNNVSQVLIIVSPFIFLQFPYNFNCSLICFHNIDVSLLFFSPILFPKQRWKQLIEVYNHGYPFPV